MKRSIKFSICLLGLVFFLVHCSRDEAENAEVTCDEVITYNEGAKSIIDGSCAYAASCHASGGQPPDYSSYENIIGTIDADDQFENRVFILGDMPPIEATPLDTTQIHTLRCWSQEGFPEN